jgi:hypothetical protein
MKTNFNVSEDLWWRDDRQQKAVHTHYSFFQPEGLAISSFRPDSKSSLELNPLAAGYQTLFEKGDTAYCPKDMNRLPILNQNHNLKSHK